LSPKSVVRVMIGRCANVTSLEDWILRDEKVPDISKVIGRGRSRQGTRVMGWLYGDAFVLTVPPRVFRDAALRFGAMR
jgi:hypothetical protein